jgi:hypothetical protein
MHMMASRFRRYRYRILRPRRRLTQMSRFRSK